MKAVLCVFDTSVRVHKERGIILFIFFFFYGANVSKQRLEILVCFVI